MVYEFNHQIQVEFHETDMAGIVHFSNYVKYMECTELRFYEALKAPLMDSSSPDNFGLPRVHVSCDYKAPLRFKDKINVRCLVEKLGNKSITYQFQMTKGDTLVAVGRLVVVCVSTELLEGSMKTLPLPASLTSQLKEAPKELLVSKES